MRRRVKVICAFSKWLLAAARYVIIGALGTSFSHDWRPWASDVRGSAVRDSTLRWDLSGNNYAACACCAGLGLRTFAELIDERTSTVSAIELGRRTPWHRAATNSNAWSTCSVWSNPQFLRRVSYAGTERNLDERQQPSSGRRAAAWVGGGPPITPPHSMPDTVCELGGVCRCRAGHDTRRDSRDSVAGGGRTRPLSHADRTRCGMARAEIARSA